MKEVIDPNAPTKHLTPSERLQQAPNLYYSAKELKRAGLQHFHPNWTNEQIENKLREIFANAKS